LPLQLLQQFITAIHPLKADELELFLLQWEPFECKRKVVLTAAGTTERNLYFVLDGVQRCYCLTPQGSEATVVFTYPHSFSGVADSFLTQTPTQYVFETLTASRFLRTTYGQMERLMHHYPNVQTLFLKATAFAMKGLLERQAELQYFSAEDKFRSLLRRSPHVLQLISHKYLASYLGIDPATFSKLLGSVRI
jgi:CRP-like cAMP-binding protein